jgi:plasmid stabilization system protein ParE
VPRVKLARVIVTAGAGLGLERCREFLNAKNKAVVARAGQAIEQQFKLLETNPDIGRPYATLPTAGLLTLRELVIDFGDSGYVALYRYESTENVVYVLAFRHQKEAGY